MPPVILASASPARQSLLRRHGIAFDVCASQVRELRGRGRTLRETVLANARRKAEAVARRCPGRVILAADTMIEFGGRLFGKPASRAMALRWMEAWAGRQHRLGTGVVLLCGNQVRTRFVVTRVQIRALDRATFRRRLATTDPTRMAGGYAIRRGRDPLIERISGSHSNVVGLPMEVVAPWLRRWSGAGRGETATSRKRATGATSPSQSAPRRGSSESRPRSTGPQRPT